MTRPFIIYILLIASFICLSIFVSQLWCIGYIVITFITFMVEFLFIFADYDPKIFGIRHFGKLKRVKTKYGRFYVTITNKKIAVLYQDKFLYLKNIKYSNFSTIEDMRSWVKIYVDHLYKEKMEKIGLKNDLMGWNGCLDKQADRAEQLNKVL